MLEPTKETVLALSRMLVFTTPMEVQEEVCELPHTFATMIHDKAQESGLNPPELCFALCELLSNYMTGKNFTPEITNLGTVALAGVIAHHKDSEQDQKHQKPRNPSQEN